MFWNDGKWLTGSLELRRASPSAPCTGRRQRCRGRSAWAARQRSRPTLHTRSTGVRRETQMKNKVRNERGTQGSARIPCSLQASCRHGPVAKRYLALREGLAVAGLRWGVGSAHGDVAVVARRRTGIAGCVILRYYLHLPLCQQICQRKKNPNS